MKITVPKYIVPLVSPVLIFLAYNGSNVAGNLLTAWTLFTLIVTIFITILGIILVAISFNTVPNEKSDKLLSGAKTAFSKLKKISFTTAISISCFVFCVWAGWWGIAAMQFFVIVVPKIIGFIASIEE